MELVWAAIFLVNSQFVIFQIAHFKIPRYIKFTDEFPLTVTGKVRTSVVALPGEEVTLNPGPDCSKAG